jgi:signal transduction histidine kinase/HAMP domain-containing protein
VGIAQQTPAQLLIDGGSPPVKVVTPMFGSRPRHTSIVSSFRSSVVAVMLLFAVAAGAGLMRLLNIERSLERLHEVHTQLIAAAYEMEINVIGRTLGIIAYLEEGSEPYRQRADKDRADYAAFRRTLGVLADFTDAAKILPELDATYEEFDRIGVSLVAASTEIHRPVPDVSPEPRAERPPTPTAAGQIARDRERLLVLRDSLDDIIDDTVQRIIGAEFQDAQASVRALTSQTFGYTVAALTLLMCVFVGAGEFMVRAFRRPLDRLVKGIKAIDGANLERPIRDITTPEFVTVVDHFNTMLARLQASRQRLRDLSTRMETLRDHERARIAREIHDDLGQRLMTLKLALGQMRHAVDPDDRTLRDRYGELVALLDDSTVALRRIVSELHPAVLDRLNFLSAVEWLTDTWERQTGVPCYAEFDVEGDIPLSYSAPLFRVLQEALTNAARHAAASRVTVRLHSRAARLRLIIEDDGVGISDDALEDPRKFGLFGMRERVLAIGGRLRISRRLPRGTTIEIEVSQS